jgi:hypothetical protein
MKITLLDAWHLFCVACAVVFLALVLSNVA